MSTMNETRNSEINIAAMISTADSNARPLKRPSMNKRASSKSSQSNRHDELPKLNFGKTQTSKLEQIKVELNKTLTGEKGSHFPKY